jgi:hypothetical protein
MKSPPIPHGKDGVISFLKLILPLPLSHSLQKAVNTPVNAISPASRNHLEDKLMRLSRLISGQPVEVGLVQIVASVHQEGIAFRKNLMAKKFVVSILVTVITVYLSLSSSSCY